jgi:CRP-like cAMP-binding protein
MTYIGVAPTQMLDGLEPLGAEVPPRLLAVCATMTLEAGEPYFQTAFPADAFISVEEGFVVVRASGPPPSRSVITSVAGPGELLLPPEPDEVVVALTEARLALIGPDSRARLLQSPDLVEQFVDALTVALRQKQQAAASLGPTRHRERVRLRLSQLAAQYGHVVRGGIRIDFPLSHALLAEMIASSRETVTRALDELQRSGFVSREGSTYRVRALD